MSSFLYFTEQAARPVSLEDARGWGLGYAFDAKPSSTEISGRTPSGGKGWLFFDGKRHGDAFIGYNDALQTWKKIPGSDVWVGVDKAKRPTPESLARKERLSGILFTLGDGNEWSIPKLTYFSTEHGFVSSLVRYLTLDDEGKWTAGRVKGGHDDLVDLGDRLAAALVYSVADPTIPELTPTEAGDSVATLLRANYYVSMIEVDLLELLSEDLILPICEAVVDAEAAFELVKKKNQADDEQPT